MDEIDIKNDSNQKFLKGFSNLFLVLAYIFVGIAVLVALGSIEARAPASRLMLAGALATFLVSLLMFLFSAIFSTGAKIHESTHITEASHKVLIEIRDHLAAQRKRLEESEDPKP